MQIDPRGPRVVAGLTSFVLAVGLVTSSPWVLGFQAVVFAIGAFLGVTASPYSLVFRTFVRPRLGPPDRLEDAAAPRFAQAVGLVFAVVATLGFATGLTVVGLAATALALAAAFLNAAFGFCLGCEVYLLARRVTARSTASSHSTASPHSTAASRTTASRSSAAGQSDSNAVTTAATKEVTA